MTALSRTGRTASAVLWLLFFAAILAAWLWLWRMVGMAGLDPLGRATGPNMMPMTTFASLFGMWATMMAAMMLPTLVPTLGTYEGLVSSGAGSRAGWLGVLAGYFVIWLGFAAAIATVQAVLISAGVLDELGAVGSRSAAGALLTGTGLWQFTRVKRTCHGVCISPMTWFLGRWRPGFAGGARMGVGLGTFCVGCCWTYMALGFAGGTMNLAWMGLATALMIMEKLPDVGLLIVRPAGALMIAGGIAWGVS